MAASLKEMEILLFPRKKKDAVNESKSGRRQLWERFRPVAAFWAAHVILEHDTFFPCTLADLPRFLAVGNFYRELAETTIPPRCKWPILKPGQHVGLPKDVLDALPQRARLTVPTFR